MEPTSRIFCIDCGKATPIPGSSRPAACAHCGSSFPSDDTTGTHIAEIPPSGMATAPDEPDLDPEKFWEIPAAFRSREEADTHHRKILHRKITTALFVLAVGIATTYYLYSTAPPFRWSDAAEAAVQAGVPDSEKRLEAVKTAVAAVEAESWESLKPLVTMSGATPIRMERFYRETPWVKGDVREIAAVGADGTTPGRYQVDLILKHGSPARFLVDLSGSAPSIDWERSSGYPLLTWKKFAERKSSVEHEVYVYAQQIAPTSSALEATGIPVESAVGLALWHSDSSRSIYSVIDRSTPTGEAIAAATSPEDPAELVLTLVPAPEGVPSFLVIVRNLVQVGWETP